MLARRLGQAFSFYTSFRRGRKRRKLLRSIAEYELAQAGN
jgi:hypothetical protein